MTDTFDSSGPINSSLNREYTANDKTVQIVICADGAGGWLLEIIDDHSHSTCWQAPFKTDQEALDEGLRALEEEGIDYFIGAKEQRHSARWFQPSKNLKRPFKIQYQ